MRKSNLLETLEDRRLLAADITLGPNNLYFNAVTGQSQTYELRVVNTGDKRVILKRFQIVGNESARFKVLNFPAAGRSLGAGGQVNYTVQFSAGSSYQSAVQTATLRLYTDIPGKKPYSDVVPLRGMITKGTSGSSEPSLQKIFDLYGLPIDSGETNREDYKYPSNPSSTSDEIDVDTFVKAGTGPVTVAPIAVFTNNATPAVRTGYYTPGDSESGKYLYYVPGATSQSVNPSFFGTTKFDPGSAEFGLLSQYPAFIDRTTGDYQKVYSEDTLNSTWSQSSSFDHFRVFPFINQQKQVVPNAYVVAQEEYSDTGVADNNDNIFLVTNVKPATGSPTLSVFNTTGQPDNETLVFNKVQNPNADVPNLTRTSNTLRVRNTGTAPLVVSIGLTGSDYSIASGGGSNITLAAGASREVRVNFTATGGTAPHAGELNITSNDPANPKLTVNLIGIWQQFSEQNGQGAPSVEPSAQTIVNRVFGFTTQMPNSTQLKTLKNNIAGVGDQIDAQYFVAADGGPEARVSITELATFHNQTYLDANGVARGTNSYMGWFTKNGNGSYNYRNNQVITDKVGTGQMILPTPNASSFSSNVTGTTTGNFKPGNLEFGFSVERKNDGSSGEYSDYSLNGNKQYLRFFVAKDKNGLVIPNTYIMLHDYNRPDITNFDFNDSIYLIRNIVPVNKIKSAPTAIAVRNGGVLLNWSSPTDGPKITGFNVYRSTSAGGTYALLTGTPLNARPGMAFRDSDATGASPYYYAIEGVGPSGVSDRVYVMV